MLNKLKLVSGVLCASALAQAALPPVQKVGMDIDGYCKAHYGSQAEAFLRVETVFGWKCRVASKVIAIDFTSVCREQHGTSLFGYTDYRNASSAYCGPGAAHENPYGYGPEVQDYCENLYGQKSRAIVDPQISPIAYGWRCETRGLRNPVDMHDACRRQLGTQQVGLGDQNNPFSWYCIQ